MRWLASVSVIFLLSLAAGAAAAMAQPAADARVDAVFARWTTTTPGCAVGVGADGRTVLTRGYGMAELEHDVPNEGGTIFEAGSVTKQFTAAAVLLLARDGKLSLDDPVRQHIPEVPDFGVPLTVRHMLTHTSGLRDWGNLAAIAGWPRGTRVHTHAHVLDIVSRQRALNFTPGSRYSYSNSGYNLAAILVARLSGLSFAEFTRTRLFEPLGMTHTSWRDDFTRVVKGRAQAYARAGEGPYTLDMPFENVHGNGGLLTTVGDLLIWNENFVTPRVGDRAFVDELQRTVPFTSGTMQTYALGLRLGVYKGVREVHHSGATGGYRAFLTRFPDQHVSVAVLCNAADADAAALAHAVADLYLGDRLNPAAPRDRQPAEMRGPVADMPTDAAYAPSAADLAAFAGTYRSDEAETTLVIEVRDGALVAWRRPDTVIPLRPHAADRFDAGPLGIVTFHRREGRVESLGVTQDRVWDLRFTRAAAR
ncbi:MAG: serine hydrolase domain-containing protein [Acidobacteriota bacterium]